jgi:glucose/arabinose dehydrogenase
MHARIPAVALAAALPVVMVAQSRQADVTSTAKLKSERLASLEYPWGMAYLPDGRLLITEKPGRLRVLAGRNLSAIDNVPKTAYRPGANEQGGLLDVAVDPDFVQNGLVYLSYSEEAAQPASTPDPGDPRFGKNLPPGDTRMMGGAVMRAKLEGNRLTDSRVIWRQEPKTVGRGHFGHRLLFGPDGMLFITSGERMRFDPAQSLASNLGKVVRIDRDGSIPPDNPFAGKPDARGEIWSQGHRNMLAAAFNAQAGQLWVVEMGPLGGDELNLIEAGGNYGWPAVSDGDNYDRSPIPDHQAKGEFKAPVRTWTPVISPSGALFYDGAMFPWRGSLVVGGLSSKGLIRLTLEGTKVAAEERLDLQKRIRDVIQAPDGALLVITDDQKGELLRLTPAAASTTGQ